VLVKTQCYFLEAVAKLMRARIAAKLSAVQDYKTQLPAQKSKLRELFNSALHKSMQN